MSFISNAPFSNDVSTESSEESGWTMYLEDFFNNQNDNQKCSMSLSCVASSSSLVSDAASLAGKKIADDCKQSEEFNSVNKNGKRSSSFKKRKDIITANLVDDALEDTASSSLNSSPKVLYANQFENSKQTEEVNLFQEKGNTSTSGQRNERKEQISFNGRDGDCTEIKKRGLNLFGSFIYGSELSRLIN